MEPSSTTLYTLIGRCFGIDVCNCYDYHSGSVRDWRSGYQGSILGRRSESALLRQGTDLLWVPPVLSNGTTSRFLEPAADRSQINNIWRYTSTSPYVFTQYLDSCKLNGRQSLSTYPQAMVQQQTTETGQCDVFTPTTPTDLVRRLA